MKHHILEALLLQNEAAQVTESIEIVASHLIVLMRDRARVAHLLNLVEKAPCDCGMTGCEEARRANSNLFATLQSLFPDLRDPLNEQLEVLKEKHKQLAKSDSPEARALVESPLAQRAFEPL